METSLFLLVVYRKLRKLFIECLIPPGNVFTIINEWYQVCRVPVLNIDNTEYYIDHEYHIPVTPYIRSNWCNGVL